MRVATNRAEVIVFVLSRKTGSDLVIPRYAVEVDNFSDPQGQPAFRNLDGRETKVREWIQKDPKVVALTRAFTGLARDHVRELKEPYITFGVRDYQGRWRAAAVGELVADALEADGFKVSVEHRWLPR